ncbi:MAG: recombinase family protein [Alphaproteobacteria bacterium]|nr:recombinase family protein [Alphaproteobacteria bacterium]
MTGRAIRCAIYTRKSSEEGLNQSFNSLDAQREACAAYIKSQASEGWLLVHGRYDDGGYSGGNMDRPGLHRLLTDIDNGRIDCVVVYKIDRLTRSLGDFAKIVECFDQRKVTFVSVTQSFNTTTSMGRLTLNVLLSFAQFEREVTAERIRDKFAASRAKGIFMGGNPPLGYDARDRKLIVNESEAKTVRMIFRRYLELGSVAKLREELDAERIKTKVFVSTRGNAIGGGRWYVGPLRHLLRNPVYVGLARHKGNTYAGEHEAIIDKSLFDQVQARLSTSALAWARKRTIEASALLTGLIFDDKGNRMSPQWSIGRNGTKHGYYVSQALLQRRKGCEGSLPRVAARLVDDLVVRCVSGVLSSTADEGDTDNGSSPAVFDAAKVRAAVERVTLGVSEVTLNLKLDRRTVKEMRKKGRDPSLTHCLPPSAVVTEQEHGIQITVPGRLQRRGGAKRVEGWSKSDWSVAKPNFDKTLVAALVRARRWCAMIERGEISSIEALADREGMNRRRVLPLLRIAFLAPDIQAAIVEGRQPVTFNLKRLTELGLPGSWQKQRRLLGLSVSTLWEPLS